MFTDCVSHMLAKLEGQSPMSRKTAATVKLTEAVIASIPAPATRIAVWDSETPGLLLRVSPVGRKTFVVCRRRRGGSPEWVTLGAWPALPLKAARQKALEVIAKLAGGSSVAEERRSAGRQITLGELWELYLGQYAKIHKRSWRTDEVRWNKHLAHYAGIPVSKVTTAMVSEWLGKITVLSGAGSANRVRSLLATMFNIGRRQLGLKISNPVTDTVKHRERSKTRYLQPDELRRLIDVCRQNPGDAADWCTLALLTGARAGSLNAMRWQDLNLEDATWCVPAEYMKAGRGLLLPLAKSAVAILKRRAKHAAGEWVFPSTTRPGAHIVTPRESFRKFLRAAKISSPTTPHDLRRTMATYGVEAGVGLGEIAGLLGHTRPGGVTAVYARVPFSALRRAGERIEQAILTAGRDASGQLLAFRGGS